MNNMFDTYPKLAHSEKNVNPRLKMHTRNPTKIPLNECTAFVLHVSQKSEFAGAKKKLIDYFECKLKHYIASIDDKQQLMLLNAMLADYVAGHIAVAWRKGHPVYVKVTKG